MAQRNLGEEKKTQMQRNPIEAKKRERRNGERMEEERDLWEMRERVKFESGEKVMRRRIDSAFSFSE